MKVGVVTLHRVFNYGSALQAFATQIILEKLGCDVEIIDYITEVRTMKRILSYCHEKYRYSVLKRNLYILSRLGPNILKYLSFNSFVKKHLKLSKRKYYTIHDLRKFPPQKDVYITGSDQVWNSDYNEMIDKGFFLDFGPKNIKRISYAASFGKDSLDDNEKMLIFDLLKNYNHISVREKQAQNILSNIGIDAQIVLDPTLLISKEEWLGYIKPKKYDSNYLLLCLMYGDDYGATDYARKIADEKGLKIIKICWRFNKPKGIEKIAIYKTPFDFLRLIRDADYVVTNSFHATAFCINFNKQFTVVARKVYNSRLSDLISTFNLNDKYVTSEFSLENALSPINYEEKNLILKELREKSIKVLKNYIYDN